MPSYQRKIKRQKRLGNYGKVRKLVQNAPPRAKAKLQTQVKSSLTGGEPPATGSTSEAAANQPPPPSPPTPLPTPAPPQGTGPFDVSSYNPATGAPDPRDADYWENYAVLIANAQQEYGTEQLEGDAEQTAWGLRQVQEQEGQRQGVRNLAESLIGTGLLRSGHHTRTQGENLTDFSTKMRGLEDEVTSSKAQRQARMAAILQNLGIEEGNLYSDAGQRYAAAEAAKAAEDDALAEIAGAPEAGAAAAAEAAKKKRTPTQLKAKQKRQNIKAKKMGATSSLGVAKKKKKK